MQLIQKLKLVVAWFDSGQLAQFPLINEDAGLDLGSGPKNKRTGEWTRNTQNLARARLVHLGWNCP